jgi:1-acyl-sn-glycerol-3-phosphate acyltransferase
MMEKPRTENLRPHLTRLPELTARRRLARRILRRLLQGLAELLTATQVRGLENLPRQGQVLLVTNHLGDADALVGLAYCPRQIDTLAKIELYDLPVLGALMDAYGMIWLHRGQPDRRALRAALDGLAEGRLVTIAPEGRESLTGALEEATDGAAYIALRSGAPLLPVTFTGTENRLIFGNLKRLHRPRISITVGPPFYLDPETGARTHHWSGPSNLRGAARAAVLQAATETLMRTLAAQLPPEYQGVYRQDRNP